MPIFTTQSLASRISRQASALMQFSAEDFEDSDLSEQSVSGKSALRRDQELFCFFCNRMELHFNAFRTWKIFPVLLGLTLGAIHLIGPFRCRCCGHKRYFSFNEYHPRVLLWRLRDWKNERKEKILRRFASSDRFDETRRKSSKRRRRNLE